MGVIGIGMKTLMFAKDETVVGTPVYPVGTDVVRVVGEGTFDQQKNFYEDEQKRATLSRFKDVPGRFKPGTFNITSYIKPIALGTAPKPGIFLKNLWGIETATPATKVEYTLADIDTDVKTMTVVFQKDLVTYFNFGVAIDQGTFPVEAGQIGRGIFAGQFLRQKIAGQTVTPAGVQAAGLFNVEVNDCRNFEDEALVQFGTEDNAGVGYELTGVSYTSGGSNYVKIKTALLNDISVCTVKGFIPTAVDSGVPVAGEFGTAQECDSGGSLANVIITKSEITVKNNLKVITEEKGGNYPVTILKTSKREVDCKISKILKEGDVIRYEVDNQVNKNVEIPCGSIAGLRYRFCLPYLNYQNPAIAGEGELILSRDGKVYGLAGDDEAKLVFD